MILQTEANLAQGGDAIARAPDGRIVFVEGAAPSEKVRVAITRENPRFLRARAVEILEPSPHRVAPRCRHFGECGGCVLQHVDHASQVASKQAALIDAVARIARLDPTTIQIRPPWSGAPYGYRTRVRFAIQDGRAGYRKRKSNEIFDAAECPILAEPLERFLLSIDRSTDREITAVADGTNVELTRVFGQANDAGNRAMIEELDLLLADRAPFARALELYGGSGNFTRTIAAHAASVTMVESSREATAIARAALPAVRILERAAEDAPEDPAELVVVDPPRAGMSELALERAATACLDTLVYVSCDPATFARDAGRLAQRALALDSIRLFDLYPQTAHAEVVARFRRITA